MATWPSWLFYPCDCDSCPEPVTTVRLEGGARYFLKADASMCRKQWGEVLKVAGEGNLHKFSCSCARHRALSFSPFDVVGLAGGHPPLESGSDARHSVV